MRENEQVFWWASHDGRPWGLVARNRREPRTDYASVLVWREDGHVKSEVNVPDDVSDMSAAVLKMESEQSYVGDIVVTGPDGLPQEEFTSGSMITITAPRPDNWAWGHATLALI